MNNERRATFATPDLELQVRRTLACLRALDRYDTTGIESGAVQQLIDAALEITSGIEAVHVWWKANRGKPLPFQMLSHIVGPCRDVLEAKSTLKERE